VTVPSLFVVALGLLVLLGQDSLPDPVVQLALATASAQLGVPADTLVIVDWLDTDWPDSSLGCPEPGKAYAQVVTAGYLVTVDTDDAAAEVQVHTDRGSRGAIC
jgi:hypothetical protein